MCCTHENGWLNHIPAFLGPARSTRSMIFFSYVNMHFSYVKSNILRKWLKKNKKIKKIQISFVSG